jgi:hypothetical protein
MFGFILLLGLECSCLSSCYSCPCCSPKNFKYKYSFGHNLSWGSCFFQSLYWCFFCYGTQVFVFGIVAAQENIKIEKQTMIMKFPSMEFVLGSTANSIKINAPCAPKLKVEINIWLLNSICYGSMQVVIRLW